MDQEKTKGLLDIVKGMGRQAVFHRAFDCVEDPFHTMEQLIGLGVDRVLTSGLKPTAMEGRDMIRQLQMMFGDRIQILAGSGVNGGNVRELVEYTGVSQVHSSCKAWRIRLRRETGFPTAWRGETRPCAMMWSPVNWWRNL